MSSVAWAYSAGSSQFVVLTKPVASIDSPLRVDIGVPATATAVIVSAGSSNITYTWSANNATLSATNTQSIQFTATDNIGVLLMLTVNDGIANSNIVLRPVSVDSPNPLPEPEPEPEPEPIPIVTRITEIIRKARVTLGDKSKTRYSDEDMLDILDEAQQDFAKQSQILKRQLNIMLSINQGTIDLPKECWIITRATFADVKLPLMTYEDLDFRLSNSSESHTPWETHRGFPKALVYDRSSIDTVRLYPIPDESIIKEEYNEDDLGVVYDTDQGTFSPDYGVATSFNSEFGVFTEMQDFAGVLKLFYIRNPLPIKTVSDAIETPEIFDVGLKYYVVAHCFLNDLDSGWQDKGLQQLRFYEREVERARKAVALNNVSTGDLKTNYRSAF